MKALLQWGLPFVAASLIVVAGCIPVGYIGGNVSGLTGNLGLSLNGAEILAVRRDGLFIFKTQLAADEPYSVTVATQPAGETCVVANGRGVVADALITDITVTCGAPTVAPVISHVGPGRALEGYEIRISGSNLDFTSVAYNGAAMAPTLQAANEIRFVVPENPRGVYTLELENNAGVARWDVTQTEVMRDAVALDVGQSQSCALFADGTVRCWGKSQGGSVHSTKDGSVPMLVGDINTAVAISAGGSQSCAVLEDATVRCWSSIDMGQSDSEIKASPAIDGLGSVAAVEMGALHSCALLSGGSIRCWGGNEYGQLGNGSNNPGPTTSPVTVSGISTAVAISTNGFHTCALLRDRTVQCWGYNVSGQLGNGSLTNSRRPVVVEGISNAIAISVGDAHSCALLDNGNVQCWGRNSNGQLGTRRVGPQSATPASVDGIAGVVAIDAYASTSCAVLSSGIAQCWGQNNLGQLGDGSMVDRYFPTTVAGVVAVAAVKTGGRLGCALSTDGVVQCWGYNFGGSLGTRVQITSPMTISGIDTTTAAGTTVLGNCAAQRDGTVRCWGRNVNGELGTDSMTSKIAPVVVSGINTAVAVGAGFVHYCALLSSGSVQCWRADSPVPMAIGGISTAKVLGVGEAHNCVVLDGGTVQCWGSNQYGQLGDGTTTHSQAPVTVVGIGNAVAISASSSHSCAVTGEGDAGGEIWCWGSNFYGQLGNGSTTSSATPVRVSGITTAVAIHTTNSSTCAVLANGEVQCWGYSLESLGGNSTTPEAVADIDNAVAISASRNHSCVLMRSGEVRCWGFNIHGELGNGTTIDSATPVTVVGINTAVALSVSQDYSCASLASGALQCWGSNEYGQLAFPMILPAGRPISY